MNFPEQNCPVPNPAGECHPIWTERHTIDWAPIPGEDLLRFARLDIPQQHRPVRSRTGNPLTIRAECYAIEPTCMPCEALLLFTRFDIPQQHTFITESPATGKRPPIRAERYA